MATMLEPAAIAAMLDDRVIVTPFDAHGLPAFIQPRDAALAHETEAVFEWMAKAMPALETLLADAGAFVLRGFRIDTTSDFQRILDNYEATPFGYSGGATQRQPIAERVFESTRAAADSILGMHQEMAYLPHWPDKLAFFCRLAAVTGGETFLADMRRFTAALPTRFRSKLEQRGVLYTRNFRDPAASCGAPEIDVYHKTWTDAFFTGDRDDALSQAQSMGLDAEWLGDGSLSVAYRAPGLIAHPRTGEIVSFNQIPTQTDSRENWGLRLGSRFDRYHHLYRDRPRPYLTTYGDGSPIDPSDLSALYRIIDPLITAFPWSHGDLLLVDNYLTAHGRNAYTGKRDIQVALLK